MCFLTNHLLAPSHNPEMFLLPSRTLLGQGNRMKHVDLLSLMDKRWLWGWVRVPSHSSPRSNRCAQGISLERGGGRSESRQKEPHNRRKPDPVYKMQAYLAWWLCWEDSGGAASEPGGGREDDKRKSPAEDENASKARGAGRKQ